MVYYVAYRASNEVKNRSQIARRLRALGCTHIRRAFWKVEDSQIDSVMRALHECYPVIMRRRREVERPSASKEEKLRSLGSLIVIAYKGSKRERMKIAEVLRKSPCLRLCRGVYAFSQGFKRVGAGSELVDANRFWHFIREVDENAVVIPKLVVDNPDVIERIVEETRTRIEKAITGVVEGYENLYHKVKQNQGDREYVLSTTRKLRRRFVTVKKLGKVYEKWLRINLSPLMIKPYSRIRKLHTLLDEKYEVVRPRIT
jgi:hypothetical protein